MLESVLAGVIAAVAGGIATAIVAAVLSYFFPERSERIVRRFIPQPPGDKEAFQAVLNLKANRKVVFVFPSREGNPEHKRPFRQVAMEDMLAVNFVGRGLTLGGWDDAAFRYRVSEQFAITLQAARQPQMDDERDENIILICMSRSNDAMATALDELKEKGVLDCRFKAVPDHEDRWMLEFYDSDIYSDSFEQEEAMIKKDLKLREGIVEDHALLAKVPNPWSRDRDAKMLVVAGIRGIGTWGAAWHLRNNIREIYEEVGDNDFAWVIKVTYEDWAISKTEGTPHLKILS